MAATKLHDFLAPLAKLAVKFSDLEAAVIWGDAAGWQMQDDTTEILDSEEITFYAEGLLLEGFGMIWRAMTAAGAAKMPDHILLFFWQSTAPPPPEPDPGWLILAQGTWPSGATPQG